MRQLMKVTYNETISRTVNSGEKYTCDGCGSVILDTTQIDDEFLNNNQDDVDIYNIECKIAGDRTDKHACSCNCVKKIFNEWTQSFIEKDCPNNSGFRVNLTMLQTSKIMNRYCPTSIPITTWNKIKQNSSVPKKEKN